jgi:hypothetical protein
MVAMDTMLARHNAKLAKLIQTGEENKKDNPWDALAL